MRTQLLLGTSGLLVVCALAVLSQQPAEAQPTRAPSAYLSALPKGSANPSAASSAQAATIDADPGAPTAEEWARAPGLALRRKTQDCQAFTLRDWVRVSCPKARSFEPFLGVRVIAGSKEGVALLDPPLAPGAKASDQRGFDLVFPLRKGDRRLFSASVMLPMAWRSWTVEEAAALSISAVWLDDEAAPTLTIY